MISSNNLYIILYTFIFIYKNISHSICFREAKNKYHTLLIEANSYKRSAYEETQKNYEFLDLLNKLKQEKNNLENSFKASLDKFSYLKDEHSKLIQITEFQLKNLDQVLFVCIFIKHIIKF